MLRSCPGPGVLGGHVSDPTIAEGTRLLHPHTQAEMARLEELAKKREAATGAAR